MFGGPYSGSQRYTSIVTPPPGSSLASTYNEGFTPIPRLARNSGVRKVPVERATACGTTDGAGVLGSLCASASASCLRFRDRADGGGLCAERDWVHFFRITF